MQKLSFCPLLLVFSFVDGSDLYLKISLLSTQIRHLLATSSGLLFQPKTVRFQRAPKDISHLLYFFKLCDSVEFSITQGADVEQLNKMVDFIHFKNQLSRTRQVSIELVLNKTMKSVADQIILKVGTAVHLRKVTYVGGAEPGHFCEGPNRYAVCDRENLIHQNYPDCEWVMNRRVFCYDRCVVAKQSLKWKEHHPNCQRFHAIDSQTVL